MRVGLEHIRQLQAEVIEVLQVAFPMAFDRVDDDRLGGAGPATIYLKVDDSASNSWSGFRFMFIYIR
jgi:hypothetical protein